MSKKFAVAVAIILGLALLDLARSLILTYQLDQPVSYLSLLRKVFLLGASLYLIFKKNKFGYGSVIFLSSINIIGAIYALKVYSGLPKTTIPDLAEQVRTMINLNVIVFLLSLALIGLCLKLYGEKRPLTDKELILWYIHYAKLWGKRVVDYKKCKQEDIEKGEKAYNSSWGIYFESKRRDSLDKLMQKLLNHRNDAVRALAARHLIWSTKEKSLKVLDEVGTEQNELGRVARAWAEDCRSGKLMADSEIISNKKYLPIVEYPNTWSLAKTEREGKPLFLRYREGLKDAVGHRDYPYQIGVAVPLLDPTDHGLTKDEEAKNLDRFEDALTAVLTENSEAVEALIITHDKMREFVFYAKDQKKGYYQKKVKAVAAGAHKPQFMIQYDPEWLTFQEFTPRK